jgi:hypothetical protein
MKIVRVIGALFFVCLISEISMGQQTDDKKLTKPIKILLIQIYDPIEDPTQVLKFRQAVKDVATKKVPLVISMDTIGGNPALVDEMLEILESYDGLKIAYINHARYGGVFGPPVAILLSCDKIYIHPESCLGAKCSRPPIPFEKCKNIPCSNIHERMLKFWVDGVAIRQTYIDRYLGIAKRHGHDSDEVIGLFAVSESQGRKLTRGETTYVHTETSEDVWLKFKPVMYDAKTACDKGLGESECKTVLDVLEKVSEGKSSQEIRVLLPSTIQTKISGVLHLAKSITSSSKKLNNNSDKDISKRLASWRKIKAQANAMRKKLDDTPQLQTYFAEDLKQAIQQFRYTYYQDWPTISNTENENWCIYYLDRIEKYCDKKIDFLSDQKKRQAKHEKYEREREVREKNKHEKKQKRKSRNNGGRTKVGN